MRVEKRYVVRLSEEERSTLTALVKTERRVAARKRTHAQVLLKIDQGDHGPAWDDARAAKAFDVHENTVRAIRRRLVEQGLEAALSRKKQAQPSRRRVLDEPGEEELLAMAKGKAPEGRGRWTLRLLAGKLVELEVAPSISHETVRKVLKKTRFSLTSR
ncbi:MAG: helix-turn-helix domain-containing protein [Candidatus Bipolaricaulota bacterium]